MKQQPLLAVDPAVRREFDYYPTPAWMTLALLRRVRPFSVLEPCHIAKIPYELARHIGRAWYPHEATA